MILCIESATKFCSVCIADQNSIIAYRRSEHALSHTSILTLLIEQCIEESGIDRKKISHIAISAGPGSYTGLRTGAAVAKGLCFALEAQLVGIDTLKIMAAANKPDTEKELIIPCIDARRDEVYMAAYDQNLTQIEEIQAHILTQKSFTHHLQSYDSILICSDCIDKCKELLSFPDQYFRSSEPDAKSMVSLCNELIKANVLADIRQFEPNYLKSPNITKSKKRLF